MALPLDPIPQTDPLIDDTDHMNERWYRWLSNFVTRVTSGVLRAAALHRGPVNGAITATTAYSVVQTGIMFRANWYAVITTAAGVSSSLAVTIGWTNEAGIACSKTFAALTGNTTATADGDSIPIRPKSGTVITYATTYASNPGSAMVYALDVAVEDIT